MVFLDAFPTEDREMVRAVKVLDSLIMLVAQETVDALLVFEVNISQDTISLYNFIQNVEVQW